MNKIPAFNPEAAAQAQRERTDRLSGAFGFFANKIHNQNRTAAPTPEAPVETQVESAEDPAVAQPVAPVSEQAETKEQLIEQAKQLLGYAYTESDMQGLTRIPAEYQPIAIYQFLKNLSKSFDKSNPQQRAAALELSKKLKPTEEEKQLAISGIQSAVLEAVNVSRDRMLAKEGRADELLKLAQAAFGDHIGTQFKTEGLKFMQTQAVSEFEGLKSYLVRQYSQYDKYEAKIRKITTDSWGNADTQLELAADTIAIPVEYLDFLEKKADEELSNYEQNIHRLRRQAGEDSPEPPVQKVDRRDNPEVGFETPWGMTHARLGIPQEEVMVDRRGEGEA